jgi:acetyl-CoA C-acetyltransferase
MKEVVIVSALRTAIGNFGGMYKSLLPTELITPILPKLTEQVGVNKSIVDEVILGQCIQRTDEPNTARTALLKAGFPYETTGYTVQRQCASGMQAIINAVLQIQSGMCKSIIAGGVEAMSSSPYLLKDQRWGATMRHRKVFDSVWEVLEDPIHHFMMGETAEIITEEFNISREEQDQLAFESHQKAIAAIDNGVFNDEMIPIQAKGEKHMIDEHPMRDVSVEKLARLKPVFRENGSVTAGNSSSLNDGAAALLIMSAEEANQHGIKPIAKISGFTVEGVDPKMMGIGPVPAILKGLKKLNWSLEEVDLFEINEAFASQYIAVEKELKLDRNKVNVNGSGISLGHPVGCTGARMVTTMVHELKRRKGKKAIASLCVGGGMGTAIFIENV